MATMKLLTFITISLIPTIVCSIKCKTEELTCLKLCCKEMQYYEHVSRKCKALPESERIWWESQLRNGTWEEYVEFDGCELFDYLHDRGPVCYAPYYDMKLKQFDTSYFSHVSCDRLREILIEKIVAVLHIGAIYICLPIMVVYTCIKGLKEKFIYKLFAWYLVSMVGFLTMYNVSMSVLPDKVVDLFFLYSSWLWLDVIGFQMWSGYKEANAQDNSHNNQRRFICYSIFVWGISAIFTGILYYGRGRWWMDALWINNNLILFFNLAAFLGLSVNICIIRCRAVNLKTETWFKLRPGRLILRLGLIMGFPRILFSLFYYYEYFGEFAWIIFYTLEPFVLFIVLLWKPKNCFNWNLICRNCRKSEEIPNAPEVVDIQIN